ncbi:MAG: hypothetical protein M5U26_22470 [Planctomycetota bacterium]|nr:hypothetical protein [Planctomycetota bacterium]
MSRKSIPEKEMKTLLASSGGVCAFPGCPKRLVEPPTAQDEVAFLGVMAHIVGDSRQGPRGNSPMSDEERDKHTNLLLLCGDHHKVVDAQPRTYSVPVLRRMKEDHETHIRKVTGGAATALPVQSVRDSIHSSILAVTHLPAAVFASPCAFHDGQDEQVKQRIHFPEKGNSLVRFILRDGKLFSFHNLNDPRGPFRDVVNPGCVETIRSEQWWDEPEGYRRFITLLNRGLYKFAARKRIRFDPTHKRFYFDALAPGKPRQEYYRPLNAKGQQRRNVVWQPIRKATGQPRNFWWHLAVSLAFQRVDNRQWYFSIRPERHLTADGITPLPPMQIGRRVTSKKARMWNDIYLGEVNFWRDYLSNGRPNLVLNFGDQSVVINTRMLTFNIEWPGIPEDIKPFANQTYDQDLFSRREFEDALAGDELEWREDDEDSESP